METLSTVFITLAGIGLALVNGKKIADGYDESDVHLKSRHKKLVLLGCVLMLIGCYLGFNQF